MSATAHSKKITLVRGAGGAARGAALLLALGFAGAVGAAAQPAATAMFTQLAAWNWGDPPAPVTTVEQEILTSAPGTAERAALEQQCLTLLTGPASNASRQLACGWLAMIGSPAAAPILAAHVADPELGLAAIHALEGIPGEESLAALRAALPRADGPLAARLIQALGQRRDAAAVPLLAAQLAQPDRTVAALAALGRIATDDARKTLEEFLARAGDARRAVAEDALLTLAATRAAAGAVAGATDIYRALAASPTTATRQAALTGLLDATAPDAIPALLTDLLQRGDDEGYAVVLAYVSRPGATADVLAPLAQKFATLPPDWQPAALAALARAAHPAGRALALAALDSPIRAVQAAALAALEQLGTAADMPRLLDLADAGDERARQAARCLEHMRGPTVTRALIEELGRGGVERRARVAQLLGERNAREAVAELLACAREPAAPLRQAAYRALFRVAGETEIPALLDLLRTRDTPAEVEAVARILGAVGAKSANPAAFTRAMMDGAEQQPPLQQGRRLLVLGRMGHADAWPRIAAALQSTEPVVRDHAIQAALAWPNSTAVPALLELARAATEAARREELLDAALRLVGPGRAPASANNAVARGILELNPAPAFNRRALGLLPFAVEKSPEVLAALRLAESWLDDAAVRNDAADAVVAIAGRHLKSIEAAEQPFVIGLLNRIATDTSFNPPTVLRAQETRERFR